MGKIEMTIRELEIMLNEQKKITVERCLSSSYLYNKESTDSQLKSLPIDEDKFKEVKYENKSINFVTVSNIQKAFDKLLKV